MQQHSIRDCRDQLDGCVLIWLADEFRVVPREIGVRLQRSQKYAVQGGIEMSAWI